MNLYDKIIECQRNKIPTVMVTVVSKNGESPVDVGKKMLFTEDGIFGTVGGGSLEYDAIEQCRTFIKTRESKLLRYVLDETWEVDDSQFKKLPMACGGRVELFFEFIGYKGYVTIFGGGHVGRALSQVLKPLYYHVTVVEPREEVATTISDAHNVAVMSYVDYIKSHPVQERDLYIICTPSHRYDYDVMHQVLEQPIQPRYIGMLCSKAKLKDFLAKTYETFGKDVDLGNFYSPIGLDIGGNMPEEIAISIASELISVLNEKQGHKHLRDR